jgi:GPH family glycoside/pentoside/hexuronide:cation symporter
MPELAPDKEENTKLATFVAAGALLGGMIATVAAPAIFLSKQDVDNRPIQIMAAAMGIASLILMIIPIVVINEPKLVARAEGEAATHLGFVDSLKETLRDSAFVPYVLGTNLFFFGFTVIQTAVAFHVEVLLQRSKDDLGMVLTPLFGVAAIAFPAVAIAARRFGKRTVIIGAALAFAALMGVGIPLLKPAPEGSSAVIFAVALYAAAGLPVAAFLALPNSMLADICEANARRTGERREAMFFGAQGFLQKIALGAAAGGVAWLAEGLGKSTENPLGVQLSGPLAAASFVGAAICFWRYPEARVQSETQNAP